MPSLPFRLSILASLGLLGACATAPRAPGGQGISADEQLEVVIDKGHRRVEQYVDRDAVARIGSLALPDVTLAPQAAGQGITEAQARLVANNAGRALCSRLGRYVRLEDQGEKADATVRVLVTAIVPTGRGSAGASSVLGIFSPVPFRLPTGLGALAVEAEMVSADRRQAAIMRWTRGANSVTQSARVSTIGDAWQLARHFGVDFAQAALDQDAKRGGVQHAAVAPAVRKANQALCDARFGTVSVAGRGASIFLPLSPEAIDAGAPVR